MRAGVGVLGLLLVVAIVGLLVKKQLTPTAVGAAASGPALAASMPVTTPGATPQQQSQQIQSQVRQAVEGALQHTRTEPEEK